MHKHLMASFWNSSHFRSLRSLKEIYSDRISEEFKSESILRNLDVKYCRSLRWIVYKYNREKIQEGKAPIRQPVIATAMSFFHSFYADLSFSECDPTLVIGASLLLACKQLECALSERSLKRVLLHLIPERMGKKFTLDEFFETEIVLFTRLRYSLLRFLPYDALSVMSDDLQRYVEENLRISDISPSELPSIAEDLRSGIQTIVDMSWMTINDMFLSCCVISYPPHILALSAIFMNVSALNSNAQNLSASSLVKEWFAELDVYMTKIKDVIKETILVMEELKNTIEKRS